MPESIVLNTLQPIRPDIAEVKADHQEFREQFGQLKAGYASLSRLVDRIAGDVQQIKRRLDIAEAPV